jgi:hypothetical protein
MPAASPTPCCKAFHVPKRGNTADEYEDAWAVDLERGRFAVADGASESTYAALWSRLLAESFVAARHCWNDRSWLDPPRRSWAEKVDNLELPWYAEMKRDEGAFATFLGVGVVRLPTTNRSGSWRALAVGDACLFHMRGRSIHAFPMSRSEDFGNQPRLLGSRGRTPLFALDRGLIRTGDRLYLMTDALAQWFLARDEQKKRPWSDLQAIVTAAEPVAAFVKWIDDQRDRTDLRNDDVTLLTVDFAPARPLQDESADVVAGSPLPPKKEN